MRNIAFKREREKKMKTKSLVNVYMEYTHTASEELALREINVGLRKIIANQMQLEKDNHQPKANGMVDFEMEDGSIEEVTKEECDTAIEMRYNRYSNWGVELIATYKPYLIEGIANYMGLKSTMLDEKVTIDELIKTYGNKFVLVYEDKQMYKDRFGKMKTKTVREFALVENGEYNPSELQGRLVMLANGKGKRFPKKFVAVMY